MIRQEREKNEIGKENYERKRSSSTKKGDDKASTGISSAGGEKKGILEISDVIWDSEAY